MQGSGQRVSPDYFSARSGEIVGGVNVPSSDCGFTGVGSMDTPANLSTLIGISSELQAAEVVPPFRQSRCVYGDRLASVLSQKFAKQVGCLPALMPAKTGIQNYLIFLDSGSR